ncbi:LysR family carnitine catabolism transcriptional activator [Comamonas sp. 4034]
MPEITPTMRQLTCFKELANFKSFTTVADALSISQPAVSSAIRELEKGLDTNLFDRSTHHVRLTNEGEAIREHVEWMVNSFENGVRELHQSVKYRTSTIRIACIPSALHLLAPWLSKWRLKNPLVNLKLVDMHSDELSRAMATGNADIGMGLEFRTSRSVQLSHVENDEMMVVFPAGHPLSYKEDIDWNDLRREHLVILDRGNTFQIIQNALDKEGIDFSRLTTLNFIESLYALVANNCHLGLAFKLQIKSHPESGLVFRPLKELISPRKICLMLGTGKNDQDSALSDLWSYLLENINKHRIRGEE